MSYDTQHYCYKVCCTAVFRYYLQPNAFPFPEEELTGHKIVLPQHIAVEQPVVHIVPVVLVELVVRRFEHVDLLALWLLRRRKLLGQRSLLRWRLSGGRRGL